MLNPTLVDFLQLSDDKSRHFENETFLSLPSILKEPDYELMKTQMSKSELYRNLAAQLHGLLDGERDFIANAANVSSLLYHSVPDLNWAGFYLHKGGELVLGPFQGEPACVRIAIGKGVCGTAADLRQTVVVANVHDFPGHVACDTKSNSEIVVPLIKDQQLIGVLDLDSPLLGRFDDDDARGLNGLAEIFIAMSDEL